MKEPFDLLNEMSDESMSEKQTLEEWLEWLITLRSELDMKISATENDIKNLSKKKKVK